MSSSELEHIVRGMNFPAFPRELFIQYRSDSPIRPALLAELSDAVPLFLFDVQLFSRDIIKIDTPGPGHPHVPGTHDCPFHVIFLYRLAERLGPLNIHSREFNGFGNFAF